MGRSYRDSNSDKYSDKQGENQDFRRKVKQRLKSIDFDEEELELPEQEPHFRKGKVKVEKRDKWNRGPDKRLLS